MGLDAACEWIGEEDSVTQDCLARGSSEPPRKTSEGGEGKEEYR